MCKRAKVQNTRNSPVFRDYKNPSPGEEKIQVAEDKADIGMGADGQGPYFPCRET